MQCVSEPYATMIYVAVYGKKSLDPERTTGRQLDLPTWRVYAALETQAREPRRANTGKPERQQSVQNRVVL